MEPSDSIFVAGHRGLVGSALVRKLQADGHNNLLLKTRQEVDLLSQAAVNDFFASNKPAYVFVAAARVGGIHANQTQQADFLYENLVIAANCIHAAHQHDATKLLFLGSSCIYPKHADQPMHEDALLTGPLEPTNEGYAIAKIAGLKLCEMYNRQYGRRFVSAMPTNLYGPGDNFHPEHSHVVPGLLRRFHVAKQEGASSVTMWGTGSPKREFLHVDDLASALVHLMKTYEDPTTINVGSGEELSILDLAQLVKKVVGFEGDITTDPSKPDGTPRKLLDSQRLRSMGWKPDYDLETGLRETYTWAVENNVFS